MKMEWDYLNGWIQKGSYTKKNSTKMVNPVDIAGNTEEKERGVTGITRLEKRESIPGSAALQGDSLPVDHWVGQTVTQLGIH